MGDDIHESETLTDTVDDGTNKTTTTETTTFDQTTTPDVVPPVPEPVPAPGGDVAPPEPPAAPEPPQPPLPAPPAYEPPGAAQPGAEPIGATTPEPPPPPATEPPPEPSQASTPEPAPVEGAAAPADAVEPAMAEPLPGEVQVEPGPPFASDETEIVAPPGAVSTIEGVSVEDAPHAAVVDSIGQAQTAETVATQALDPNGPTGEEPIARPDVVDADGTVLAKGEPVTQGDMPASGVWPEQHGGIGFPTDEALAAHNEAVTGRPTDVPPSEGGTATQT